MKRVLKADRLAFIKAINEFLNDYGDKAEDAMGCHHILKTIHGDLRVSDVADRNEQGTHCLALFTRFQDTNGTLPVDAGRTGKWNFLINCPKGEGNALAQDLIYSTFHSVIDTDAYCEKSEDKVHEPDWSTVTTTYDGELYIDINCKHCGVSGCIGTSKTLAEGINW